MLFTIDMIYDQVNKKLNKIDIEGKRKGFPVRV
jgi:hypothetical protein